MWLKSIHKNTVLVLLFINMAWTASAQAPRKFYMRFGGNGYDVGYDVKQTLDNGYIITGSTSSFGQGNTDMYLVKLDSMGNKKFEKTFGNYNNEIGKSVLQLADSSYVSVGYTNSIGFGGYDIYLVKTDKNGNLLWEKTIGGSDWDFAYSIQTTFDGGFVIAGTTYSYGRGNADGYVVKTDANGEVIWTKTYGGAYDDEFKSIVQTADGGLALTGYTKSYNDIDSGDVWVFKLDIMGDSIWCKFYGGGKEDFGNCIVQVQNTTVLISGGTRSESANGNMETLLLAYDNINGVATLNYADPSTVDEYYNHVVQGVNGAVVGCGKTDKTFGGTQYDCLVDMYTSTYQLLNFFSMGSLLDEEFYSIDKTKDKGYVLIGKTISYNAVLEDLFFLKMDSLGNYTPNITSVYYASNLDVSINIYPNPTSAGFNVGTNHFNFTNKLTLKITNLEGKNIFTQELMNKDKNYISTVSLPSGLYFVQIFQDNMILNTTKLSVIED